MKTTIVIPAYNEESRLGSTLHDLHQDIQQNRLAPLLVTQVLVVDDGSKDQTVQIAREAGQSLPQFDVIRNGINRGKGYSIRNGIEHATEDWVLIADADQSTPWPEAAKLGSACLDSSSAAIASRDLEGSQIQTHQSFLRETLGRCFNLFIRLLTGLPFKDTQCGFKLIPRKATQSFVQYLRVDRFAWDVEFLVYAKRAGVRVSEIPVVWEHKENSRVNLFRDGMEMVFTVLALRLRLIAGAFGVGRLGKIERFNGKPH